MFRFLVSISQFTIFTSTACLYAIRDGAHHTYITATIHRCAGTCNSDGSNGEGSGSDTKAFHEEPTVKTKLHTMARSIDACACK